MLSIQAHHWTKIIFNADIFCCCCCCLLLVNFSSSVLFCYLLVLFLVILFSLDLFLFYISPVFYWSIGLWSWFPTRYFIIPQIIFFARLLQKQQGVRWIFFLPFGKSTSGRLKIIRRFAWCLHITKVFLLFIQNKLTNKQTNGEKTRFMYKTFYCLYHQGYEIKWTIQFSEYIPYGGEACMCVCVGGYAHGHAMCAICSFVTRMRCCY